MPRLTRGDYARIERSIASTVLDLLVFVLAAALALMVRDCVPISTSIDAAPVEELP